MAQQGRGKTAFREFQKQANTLKRMIKDAVKKGEVYSEDETNALYEDLLETSKEEWDENGLDVEFWEQRAKNRIQEIVDSLIEDEVISALPADNDADEDEQSNESVFSSGGIELPNGYFIPDITEDECREEAHGFEGSGRGAVRGHLLLDAESLMEYLMGIPPQVIKGIVPVYNDNGQFLGWHPCITNDS